MNHATTYPHQVFGQGETTLYFGHANAYTPEAYRSLIEPLAKQHRVQAYCQRPLWRPSPDIHSIKNWHDLADDVIAYFDQEGLRDVVAVGHSLGSVTAFLAAHKRPDLIRALVMIEPVMFSQTFCLINRFIPKVFKKRVAIINKALNRPDTWDNRQQAFDFHRRARAFKGISDEVLWQIIDGCTESTDAGQVTLCYHKKWEAKCYASVTHFRKQLLQSTLPVLVCRGVKTDTIPEAFWRHWQSHHSPHHQLMDFDDAGHLLPFEKPNALLPVIQEFISRQIKTNTGRSDVA